MATLTADFIRGLSGLSAAELPDETIDTLQVIKIAEEAAGNYYDLSETEVLYYKGWKAITLLAPSLYILVPESIQDNFNKFTRFNGLQDLIDYAFAMVAEVEDRNAEPQQLLQIFPPDYDPVLEEL